MGLTGVVVEATLRAEPLAIPVGRGRHRPHRRPRADARADERRGAPPLLGGMARPARRRREDGTRGRQPRRPAARRTAPRRRAGGGARRAAHIPARSRGGPALEVPRGFPGAAAAPGERARVQRAALARRAAARARARRWRWRRTSSRSTSLGEWNRLYGSAGLIQYQFVIPTGARSALERCFELIRTRRLPVYLAVFKRLGAAFGGPLSFPLEGWTLAARHPGAPRPGLRAALDELDELVAGCGGRVYLTKDARLRPRGAGRDVPRARPLPRTARQGRPRRGAALGSRAAPGTVRSAARERRRAPARAAGVSWCSAAPRRSRWRSCASCRRARPREVALVGRDAAMRLARAAEELSARRLRARH